MAELTERSFQETRAKVLVPASSGTRQAYRLLHVAFVVAPTVAGLDKFFNLLTHWEKYLAPALQRALPVDAHTFFVGVGVIEIAAGLLVAMKPRIGAYVVAAWLGGIIANLLMVGGFLDVALRDFGLLLAAVALGRLSADHDAPRVIAPRTRV